MDFLHFGKIGGLFALHAGVQDFLPFSVVRSGQFVLEHFFLYEGLRFPLGFQVTSFDGTQVCVSVHHYLTLVLVEFAASLLAEHHRSVEDGRRPDDIFVLLNRIRRFLPFVHEEGASVHGHVLGVVPLSVVAFTHIRVFTQI